MRRGSQDKHLIEENGEVIGINLGWDFVSEHEWGIKNIRRAFGMSEISRECLGFDARTVKFVSNDLHLFTHGGSTYLIFSDFWNVNTVAEMASRVEHSLSTYRDEDPFGSAWNDRSFGVRMEGSRGEEILTQFYESFKDLNMAVFLGGGGGNPFSNSGLTLVLRDKIPNEYISKASEDDLDRIILDEAANATGIKSRLETAGCRHFALSPRWSNEEKTEIKFWLNPVEQNKNNSGWFTVAELDQWIEGKGPVPKSQEV